MTNLEYDPLNLKSCLNVTLQEENSNTHQDKLIVLGF